MSLSKADVEKLARLSRLSLPEGELDGMLDQLNRIVGYVEQLSEVDVDGVEPMVHAVPTTLRHRADTAREDVVGRDALTGSAGYEDGLVKVPKIVE